MIKVPVPKGLNFFDLKILKGFFSFYKKNLTKDPDYGKKSRRKK